MGKYDEETNSVSEELNIAVATKTECVFGGWDISRNEGNNITGLSEPSIFTDQDPKNNPMTWCLAKNDISDADRIRYIDLWTSIQDKVLWI